MNTTKIGPSKLQSISWAVFLSLSLSLVFFYYNISVELRRFCIAVLVTSADDIVRVDDAITITYNH